jgi:hypothetical protein
VSRIKDAVAAAKEQWQFMTESDPRFFDLPKEEWRAAKDAADQDGTSYGTPDDPDYLH